MLEYVIFNPINGAEFRRVNSWHLAQVIVDQSRSYGRHSAPLTYRIAW